MPLPLVPYLGALAAPALANALANPVVHVHTWPLFAYVFTGTSSLLTALIGYEGYRGYKYLNSSDKKKNAQLALQSLTLKIDELEASLKEYMQLKDNMCRAYTDLKEERDLLISRCQPLSQCNKDMKQLIAEQEDVLTASLAKIAFLEEQLVASEQSKIELEQTISQLDILIQKLHQEKNEMGGCIKELEEQLITSQKDNRALINQGAEHHSLSIELMEVVQKKQAELGEIKPKMTKMAGQLLFFKNKCEEYRANEASSPSPSIR